MYSSQAAHTPPGLLRHQLELTQKAANEVFGGGPVAFSKYEADDVIQSESMDKLLRLISAHPYLLENSATTSINQCPIWITMSDPIVDKQQFSRVERRAQKQAQHDCI